METAAAENWGYWGYWGFWGFWDPGALA